MRQPPFGPIELFAAMWLVAATVVIFGNIFFTGSF